MEIESPETRMDQFTRTVIDRAIAGQDSSTAALRILRDDKRSAKPQPIFQFDRVCQAAFEDRGLDGFEREMCAEAALANERAGLASSNTVVPWIAQIGRAHV